MATDIDKNKLSESLEEARDLPFRILWGEALKKLYYTAPVKIEIEEVKREGNECNFVVLDEKEKIGLHGNLYLSIGIARGELFGEKGWRGEETIYPQKEVITETGEKICVMHAYLRVGMREPYRYFIFPPTSSLPIKRLKIVGRWRCWSKDEDMKDVNEYMHTHQLDIFSMKDGEQYVVVVRNWGFDGQTIDVYDEQCRKTTSIPSHGEIVIGKGVMYLQLPGAYVLEGPNNSIAKKNVFLKIAVF